MQVAQVAPLEGSLRVARRCSGGGRRSGAGERAVREEDDVDEVGARKHVHEPLQRRVPHGEARCAVRRERRERVLHGQVGVERDHLAVGGQQLEDLVLLQDVSVHRVLDVSRWIFLWLCWW